MYIHEKHVSCVTLVSRASPLPQILLTSLACQSPSTNFAEGGGAGTRDYSVTCVAHLSSTRVYSVVFRDIRSTCILVNYSNDGKSSAQSRHVCHDVLLAHCCTG